MNATQQAAADLLTLADQFKAFVLLAEKVREIGDLEEKGLTIAELTQSLLEQRGDCQTRLEATHGKLAEAEARVIAAQDAAREIRSLAANERQQILEDARKTASGIVQEARAKAQFIQDKIKTLRVELGSVTTEVEAQKKTLVDVRAQLAALKGKL